MRFGGGREASSGVRDAARPARPRGLLRRIGAMIVLVGAVVGGYMAFGPPPGETLLEAGSVAPLTQPLAPEVTPELPSPLPAHADPVPADPPPAEMEPGSLGAPYPLAPFLATLPSEPYIGPAAPEFTGAPPPPGLGLAEGTLFGRKVLGLRPELLARLRQVERDNPGLAEAVEMIVAYRRGGGSHGQGLAVDINYFANPYLMHETGEAERDAQLGPVYHGIAELMLGRPSVIPEAITLGAVGPDRTLRLYRALRDESRAMVGYFRLMQDRRALERFLAMRGAGSGEVDAELLQRRMLREYVALSGRPGPPVPGLGYPAPEVLPGDPPFAGDPAYRGPELGFMNLREELVRALTDSGLRWGGTDMAANSGDLMHFHLPASALGTPLGSRGSGKNQSGGGKQ